MRMTKTTSISIWFWPKKSMDSEKSFILTVEKYHICRRSLVFFFFFVEKAFSLFSTFFFFCQRKNKMFFFFKIPLVQLGRNFDKGQADTWTGRTLFYKWVIDNRFLHKVFNEYNLVDNTRWFCEKKKLSLILELYTIR